MSRAGSGRSDGGAVRRSVRAFRATDGLALAASPTFATMALLTSLPGGGAAGMLCSAAHPAPLSGMTAMYLLMSLFHLSPWLRLTRRNRPLPTPDR